MGEGRFNLGFLAVARNALGLGRKWPESFLRSVELSLIWRSKRAGFSSRFGDKRGGCEVVCF